MQKSIFTIIFLVVALLAVMKLQSFVRNNAPLPTDEPVFCTADAMMCPDGTYVGRSGPNCEFKCPGLQDALATTTVTLSLHQSYVIASTTITAEAITEDSRCPSDVQCIQAGLVRVALSLATPSGTSTMQLEPRQTATTETLAITLDDVTPYPISTKKIEPADYRLILTIKGK